MAATSLATLEQLPDAMLVMVMQYVAVEDILACRLVCKRLCGVALHRDVWRHRSLEDDHPRAGAVLHLAPCLEGLEVTGRVPTLVLTTTGCAVTKLILWPSRDASFNEAEYALAVRNQESLGRLKILGLLVNFCEKTEADILYRTVASCSGLLSLTVCFKPPHTTYPVVRGPPRPSLKSFTCSVDENSTSFVNAILAGHAATLEEVDLGIEPDLRKTTTADLLAAMPRLRRLECGSRLRGLEAVGKCKALREVRMHLHMSQCDSDRAAKFLRRAKQLRRVHFLASDLEDPRRSAVLADALEALASSRRSRVERLDLEYFEDMSPLVRALPSLPALCHLNLDRDPDDELLQAIGSATAPALQLLEIVVEWGDCPHAWTHRAAVKAALMANPLLHIHLRSDTYDRKHQNCETCAHGCHQGVSWHGVRKIGLYSHDPRTCPSPEAHTFDDDWKREYLKGANLASAWIHVCCSCV